jgi:hypothetical protein
VTDLVSCDNPGHGGHTVFVGGRSDGQILHGINGPSYHGLFCCGALSNGSRSHYEFDAEQSTDTVYVYRHIGDGATFEAMQAALAAAT